MYKKGDITLWVEWGRVDPALVHMPTGIGIAKEIERVPRELAQPGAGQTGTTMPIRPGIRGGSAVPERIFTELVLVDPMTQEEISRTYDIILQDDIRQNPELTDRDRRGQTDSLGTEQYIERDHWFRIQLKFIWKDARRLSQPTTE